MAWTVDRPWMDWITRTLRDCPKPQAGEVIASCRFFNRAGDFYFTLVILLGLLAVQRFRKSAVLLRMTAAVVCAACITTVVSRGLKVLVGRVRPREMIRRGVEPWYLNGPTLHGDYNSYPSGHSSLAAAGSGPLLVALPWAGIPLTAGAIVIGGSRMVGVYHHPSDVVGGLWLGFMVGCTSGCRLRRTIRRARRLGGRSA
ncbi:hypothetical protein llg_39490 [Luteolibacter sp. LG18]|nr:hypothetical protein llg_39490 [Luteolibacter sp. LG18]